MLSRKHSRKKHFRAGGTVTSFEAYARFGITQLGRCIDDLQKLGHEFNKEWERTDSDKLIKRYKPKGA
jgi:hypothetical protein